MPPIGVGAEASFGSGPARPDTTPRRIRYRHRLRASASPSASETSCWLRSSTVTERHAWGIAAWGNAWASRAHNAPFTPENVSASGYGWLYIVDGAPRSADSVSTGPP